MVILLGRINPAVFPRVASQPMGLHGLFLPESDGGLPGLNSSVAASSLKSQCTRLFCNLGDAKSFGPCPALSLFFPGLFSCSALTFWTFQLPNALQTRQAGAWALFPLPGTVFDNITDASSRIPLNVC